jgi:hypothetical protein
MWISPTKSGNTLYIRAEDLRLKLSITQKLSDRRGERVSAEADPESRALENAS